MRADVSAYMRYYSVDRLHTSNLDLSPVEFEEAYHQAVSGNCGFCDAGAGSAIFWNGEQAKRGRLNGSLGVSF